MIIKHQDRICIDWIFEARTHLGENTHAYTYCANEHLLIFTLLNLTQRHQFCCMFFHSFAAFKEHLIVFDGCANEKHRFWHYYNTCKIEKKNTSRKEINDEQKVCVFYIKLQKVWTVIQPWHAIHIPTFNQIHSVRMYFTNVAVVFFSCTKKKMIDIDHDSWEQNPIKNLMESIFKIIPWLIMAG